MTLGRSVRFGLGLGLGFMTLGRSVRFVHTDDGVVVETEDVFSCPITSLFCVTQGFAGGTIRPPQDFPSSRSTVASPTIMIAPSRPES